MKNENSTLDEKMDTPSTENLENSIPENIQVKLPTLEELKSMSPEEVQKIVLDCQNDNTKNSVIQKNAIIAAIGEVNFLKLLTAVSAYLPTPLDGYKPEDSRKLFFSSIAKISKRIEEYTDIAAKEFEQLIGMKDEQLPGLETDKNEKLMDNLYKDFKLAIEHFIYLINMQANGYGLRKDEDGEELDIKPMSTSLIYDIFINTTRIGNLLTNFTRNAEGHAFPEHRLLDMLIVHNIDMGNILGSVTMTLNSLLDVKFDSLYPGVEPTLIAKTDLLLDVIDSLQTNSDYVTRWKERK